MARRLRGIPPGHFRGPRVISAPYSLLPLRGRRAERPQARWARFGSHSARTGWACVHRFGCLEGPTCLDPRASTRSPPSLGLSFCCLNGLPALPGGPSIRPSASHPRTWIREAVMGTTTLAPRSSWSYSTCLPNNARHRTGVSPSAVESLPVNAKLPRLTWSRIAGRPVPSRPRGARESFASHRLGVFRGQPAWTPSKPRVHLLGCGIRTRPTAWWSRVVSPSTCIGRMPPQICSES